MSAAVSKVIAFSSKHPIVRGMLSYAIIWPGSSIIQQTVDGKRWGTYDWAQCGRYCLYGSCFVAPTLYSWVKLSSRIWPKSDFRTAMLKACVEQVTYGPAAMCCFFFGMSLLELKPIEECVAEVKAKFLPTYKVGICVWPFLQTINFAFVPEKNRVPFVSICSLLWTSFLAYMKQLDKNELEKKFAPAEAKNVSHGIKIKTL